MWRKLVDWHREWEDDIIAVLAQPGRAVVAQSGYRRRIAKTIAELSPIERRQLREFSEAHRGWRGYWLLARLLLLFSLGGALAHLLIPHLGWITAIFAANVFGVVLLIGISTAWFNYRKVVDRRWKLLRQVFTSGIGATLLLAVIKVWFQDVPLDKVLADLPRFLGILFGVGLLVLLPQLAVGMLRYRQYEMLTEQLQREAESERLARELSESQLRLLRAQIEPHFLFNTLGAVQQLAQHGAPRAAELTANLIDFLRSSMQDMRSEQVTLAAEFGLLESYLKVMQVRLGERLRFSLQLPRALEQVQLPSMILLTLVENAIKHGIEPALRGGEVTVSAQALDGAVRIRVQDGGVGMSTIPDPDGGGGTGLDNVRHRLRLAYGDSHPGIAGLALQDGDPGLIADVTIPCLP
jgi:sensor histidine kinase YesM